MNILDITQELTVIENSYVFNPSIIHLPHLDFFLIAYRICVYDAPVKMAPWEVWNGGYKYFHNWEQILRYKYRDNFGPCRSVPLDNTLLPSAHPEYDSTGLAIVRFMNGRIHVLANNVAPFFGEMNQDARLSRIGDEIRISYNVFTATKKCLLRWRALRICLSDNVYEYSKEYEMFETKQNVEKNCVFFGNKIIYSIGKTLNYFDDDEHLQSSVCPINHGPRTFISSSTPPIWFTEGRYLGVGHIKVEHYSPLLRNFYTSFPAQNVERHSKYVYFMFFYELDEHCRMTRLSAPFIPSMFGDHLPYLLVMPTGLAPASHSKQIIVSYGEGDCRSKLLFLERAQIDLLLKKSWDGNHFCYLTPQFRINHFGYFNKSNTGDECFKDIFTYLQKKYYPQCDIEFTSPDSKAASFDVTILGGGDVINDYFLSHLSTREPVIAVGVGIPYQIGPAAFFPFRKVFLRDKLDAEKLHFDWFPDLGFLMPKIHPKIVTRPLEKTIGISVLQTYYNPYYEHIYFKYIAEMANLCGLLLSDGFRIVLFPFGVNISQPRENDLIACMHIRRTLDYPDSLTILKELSVRDVYEKVSQMDFMICARFHSHIFAAVLEVPFISLTLGKKCVRFMRAAGLEDNLYKLKANEVDLPLEIDAKMIARFFFARYWKKGAIKAQLRALNAEYRGRMEEFERAYIRSLVANVKKDTVGMYPAAEQQFSEYEDDENDCESDSISNQWNELSCLTVH